MKKSRPLVPKRLASRLRASYSSVAQNRDRLAYIEAELIDRNLHLKEYEDDPSRFAELHYTSTGGSESYPVQTNIARTREWIERKTERMPTYLAELAQADIEMDSVEREVLETLSSMRSETSGRVIWPDEPKSLEVYRKQYLREHAKNRETYRKNVLMRYQKHIEEIARRKQESEEKLRETDALMAASLAKMPQEKAAAYRNFYEAMRAARDRGDFSFSDIVDLAHGNREVLKPIIEDAKRRLTDELEPKN